VLACLLLELLRCASEPKDGIARAARSLAKQQVPFRSNQGKPYRENIQANVFMSSEGLYLRVRYIKFAAAFVDITDLHGTQAGHRDPRQK
jgi:hypothetical protein